MEGFDAGGRLNISFGWLDLTWFCFVLFCFAFGAHGLRWFFSFYTPHFFLLLVFYPLFFSTAGFLSFSFLIFFVSGLWIAVA